MLTHATRSSCRAMTSADGKRRRRDLVRVFGLAIIVLALLWVDLRAQTPVPSDLASVELRRADELSQLCSSANATGSGLQGEYFAAPRLRGKPAQVRLDGPLDLDGQLDWPAGAGGVARPRSVRWSGWLKAPLSGSYALHFDQPLANVWIGRQQMVTKGNTADTRIELAAGRFYPVTIELADFTPGTERVRLEWTGPSGSRYVIPRGLLFGPTATAQAAQ